MSAMLKLLIPLLICATSALEVNNGVEGEPEVECEPIGITVNFNVNNEFQGNVYVKGSFGAVACHNDDKGQRATGLTIPFDDCNTQRTRSLNPRGIFVSNTVVISFHDKFITKVDRAYRVQCFYMEADKSVSQELQVSMLSTAVYTQSVPMPVCSYEILGGGPNGNPVTSVLIGQKVFHRWSCESDALDTFCMNVHSCYVDDGNGDRVDLLDQQGCATDRYLLQNLQYLDDLVAGQESHVFKYADRPQIFFKCQIAITIKEEPEGQCARTQCADPQRGRRSTLPYRQADVVDVIAELSSADIEIRTPEFLAATKDDAPRQLCMAESEIWVTLGAIGCVLCVATVLAAWIAFRHRARGKTTV